MKPILYAFFLFVFICTEVQAEVVINKNSFDQIISIKNIDVDGVSISVENLPPVSVQKFPHGLVG